MSPSPYTKVGCLLLAEDDRVLSFGFNSPHAHIPVDFWKDREEARNYIVHAEINAIGRLFLTANYTDLIKMQCVVTLMPCVPCLLALSHMGVNKVYYIDELERDRKAHDVALFHAIDLIKIQSEWIKPSAV